MTISANRANDWNEYKRLVLAELERHDEAIIRIQDQLTQLSGQIQLYQNDKKDTNIQIDKINQKMDTHHPQATPAPGTLMIPEVKWKFYAAVATVVGSAIVSIISLITALLSK